METQMITVRLSTSLVQRMDDMARRKNRSRTDILEEALRQYLSSDHLTHTGDDLTCARDQGTDEPLYKMPEG